VYEIKGMFQVSNISISDYSFKQLAINATYKKVLTEIKQNTTIHLRNYQDLTEYYIEDDILLGYSNKRKETNSPFQIKSLDFSITTLPITKIPLYII